MLIQPSVQSTSQMTTFASSVSPTGVEQAVSRAPIAPVEQASRDAGAENKSSPYQTASSAKPQSAQTQAQQTGAQASSASPADKGNEKATANADAPSDSRLQKQQEAADQVIISQLKARDQEVRIHEAAHAAVGGRYAGSASFEYKRGPDGQNYAVGGEVSISTGAISGDPKATIEKAKTIRAAALAPAQPSAQDRQIAAEAAQLELDARTSLRDEEIQARVEAEKAREQAAAEKRTNGEDQKKPVVEEEEPQDTSATQAQDTKPVFTPVEPASRADSTSQEASDKAATDDSEKPKPDARQQLEKILLGSLGLLQQANQKGLVDPQNPYGKSGYLDVIA